MTKLTASILGVILIGTVVTACSSEDEKAETKPTVVVEAKYNMQAEFACRDYRLVIHNSDVMTDKEILDTIKKVWIGSSMAEVAGFESTAREFYSSALNGDMEALLAAGKILNEICLDIPNPY